MKNKILVWAGLATIAVLVWLIPTVRFGGFPIPPNTPGSDTKNSLLAVQMDPVAVSTYSYSTFKDDDFTSSTVKASIGNLYGFSCYNGSGGTRFAQFFNTSTAPFAGASARFSFLVGTSSQVTVGNDFFGSAGINFALGIELTNSTVSSTYTAGTPGDLVCYVLYK